MAWSSLVDWIATPTKSKTLLGDLRQLIAEARQDVARQVNSALVLLCWRVGKRIRQDILKEKRAEYGEEIVTLSRQLTEEYGSGWSRHNLARMIQFAELFSNQNIIATLSQQLGWSHFKEIRNASGFCCEESSRWSSASLGLLVKSGFRRIGDELWIRPLAATFAF